MREYNASQLKFLLPNYNCGNKNASVPVLLERLAKEWLEFKKVISLVQLSKQALHYDLFVPKTILYQDKDTCAIRLGFGHLNEAEIEAVVKKLRQAYDVVTSPK